MGNIGYKERHIQYIEGKYGILYITSSISGAK